MRLRALLSCALLSLSCARPMPGTIPSSSPLPLVATPPPIAAQGPTCTGPRCRRWTAVLISGGRDRDDNVIAHERNTEFASRTLSRLALPRSAQTVLFGDGDDPDPDVSLEEPDPERHRLLLAIGMVHTAGDELHDAVLRYREHGIENAIKADHPHVLAALKNEANSAADPARRANGPPPDDLFVYVTDHGLKRADPSDNVIVLWGKRDLSVREMGRALDEGPPERRVVTVMAQCFSGSFSALVHEGGDPARPIAAGDRCGFFAAPADRPAAGCSPKSDESLYDDYTTRFFSALGGVDRAGSPAKLADLDGDGRVSFEEAHLAAIREERTLDVPVSSSEEYLRRARPAFLTAAANDRRSVAEILRGARPALRATANAVLSSIDVPPTATMSDLRARMDRLSARCWPGLCEADDALHDARTKAHVALRAAAQGTTVQLNPPSLALVLLGRARLEQWIKAAEPSFDRALQLDIDVERLRTESENAEARLLRVVRLVELSVAEESLRAEGGEVAAAYARIRACEDGGLWERDAPPHGLAARLRETRPYRTGLPTLRSDRLIHHGGWRSVWKIVDKSRARPSSS